MLKLMGPLKKGKHVGKWGITQQEITRLEIKPLDQTGNPLDKPTGSPYITQSDGEPQLQAPAVFDWHLDQLVVRGAPSIPNEKRDEGRREERDLNPRGRNHRISNPAHYQAMRSPQQILRSCSLI